MCNFHFDLIGFATPIETVNWWMRKMSAPESLNSGKRVGKHHIFDMKPPTLILTVIWIAKTHAYTSNTQLYFSVIFLCWLLHSVYSASIFEAFSDYCCWSLLYVFAWCCGARVLSLSQSDLWFCFYFSFNSNRSGCTIPPHRMQEPISLHSNFYYFIYRYCVCVSMSRVCCLSFVALFF